MTPKWPKHEGKPILQRMTPPAGTSCGGCGVAFRANQDAVSRDGKTFYHLAQDGGCESSKQRRREVL